jgi:predicted CXXCH cytochrome family protein
MHNSQGGAAVNPSGPYETLLVDDCIGCHTTAGSDPYDGTPYVMLSGATDDNCLAGGFFTGSFTNDNNTNNQHDIGSTNDPAGFNVTETPWYTGAANGLGCAGTNGCHGNQTDLNDMDAISGGHHNTSSTYRMLYVGATAVAGVPASDYEENMIATPDLADPYNVYSAGVLDPSISELCAKCHGDFHNESGSTDDCGAASPWIRHPTDVDIPGTWDIGDEGNALSASDYKNNPVGWDDAVEGTGERKATCLSCHRAHGTANDDLLRWAYSTQVAGSGTLYGCLGCHNLQR